MACGTCGGKLPGGLDELLDDDVVFYSPIVFTPQAGKAITKLYLQAAGQTLPGEARRESSASSRVPLHEGSPCRRHRGARVRDHREGKYVNGVDIIRCNDEGRIVEFRVMIRPLQAINLVHQQMAARWSACRLSTDRAAARDCPYLHYASPVRHTIFLPGRAHRMDSRFACVAPPARS